ncbi:hypothetical protein FACS1894185_4990 [Betaproteobacteria bacterium]|nr:hypothetical protein FACS1894185_4990 [Betaproteobacteria bacterium]
MRSESFAIRARAKETAFTRKRKLPLAHLTAFLLNAPRAGLQTELDAFFDHALKQDEIHPPTKSAVCQARKLLRPEALRDLLGYSARCFTEQSDIPLWHGRRVVALDGTTLRVPDVPECVTYFGGMHTSCGKFRPLARASALLDVARGAFVDATIDGYAQEERSLAEAHLSKLNPDDLLVMDRGYPSRKLFQQLCDRKIAFCARINSSWSQVRQFTENHQEDLQVDLGTSRHPLPLRLIRVDLPNGTSFELVTNILDAAHTPNDFAGLYRSRWRIEEAFKLIKARLQVENWSGIMPYAVEQDFYATLTRANCAAALALAVRPEEACIHTPEADKKGWRHRLNRTLVMKSLRHYLPRLLLDLNLSEILHRLIERLRAPSAIERTRPGRTAPRKKGVRIAGYHPAYKEA